MEKLFLKIAYPFIWFYAKSGLFGKRIERNSKIDRWGQIVIDINISVDLYAIVKSEILKNDTAIDFDINEIERNDWRTQQSHEAMVQLVGYSPNDKPIFWHQKTNSYSNFIEFNWPIAESKSGPVYLLKVLCANGLIYVAIEDYESLDLEPSLRLLLIAPIEQAGILYKTGDFGDSKHIKDCEIQHNIKFNDFDNVRKLSFEKVSVIEYIYSRNQSISYYNKFATINIDARDNQRLWYPK